MKYNDPFKIALLLFLATITIPLLAETTSPPSSTDENLANKASNIATKTINLIEDSAITAYIYAQIALDKNLSNLNINVSTDKGRVTLEGTVNSNIEENSVIKLASSASGVTTVDASKLMVKKSNQPFTDMVITVKVKSSFIYKELFDKKSVPTNINVETKNGVVYLSGKANNTLQIKNAVDLTKSISGVSSVKLFIRLMN